MNDNDRRLTRVEEKVDKIGDKVNQTREDVYQIKGDLKVYMSDVKQHVESDTKIIKHFEPLLNDLAYQRKRKEERRKAWRSVGAKLGIVATCITIVYGIIRIFKG